MMTKEKAIKNVVLFVAAKHTTHSISNYVIFVRHHYEMRMPRDTKVALIDFVSKEMECSEQQAVEVVQPILQMKRGAGLAAKKIPFVLNVIIAAASLGAMIPCVSGLMMALRLGGTAFFPALLSAAMLAGLIFLLYRFVWNPRMRAMNNLWNGEKNVTLGDLYATQTAPLGEVIGMQKKSLRVFLISIVLLLLLSIMIVSGVSTSDSGETGENKTSGRSNAGHVAGVPSLQERMEGLAVAQDNEGRGYVAYIVEEDLYATDYIPNGKWAVDAADVRAMLRISDGAEALGNYSAVGGGSLGQQVTAYRRYVVIELIDMRTGEAVLRRTVYGGDPPMLVNSTDFAAGKVADVYGPRPAEKDIKDVCERMIAEFEMKK